MPIKPGTDLVFKDRLNLFVGDFRLQQFSVKRNSGQLPRIQHDVKNIVIPAIDFRIDKMIRIRK